jgi:hypothetical protein
VIVGVTGSRLQATWNCHSVEVYPFRCSEITFREMSAAQIFIASILAESIVQDIPAFLAHTTAL